MKPKTGTKKLQCGCQTSVTFHNARPAQRHWSGAISFQDLEKDLGPGSEAWFDRLTAEHEKQERETVPASSRSGWSPCPAGGVLTVSASTPFQVREAIQYESPALWPTLFPDSPALESSSLSKSASSDYDHHSNSTAISLGFDLDRVSGDGQKGKGRLLALSMDSADLSWSSSMATPPNTAVQKFSVSEQEERQKGPARVLFSPNTSASDSEFGETDANLTIEEEEASMSLFAADNSSAASPYVKQQRTCTCRKKDQRDGDTPCSCNIRRIPVVEIHCSDDKLAPDRSVDKNINMNCQVSGEKDLEDVVPGSPLFENQLSFRDFGEDRLRYKRASTPRTGGLKSLRLRKDHEQECFLKNRCNSLTSTPVSKGSGILPPLNSSLEGTPVDQVCPVYPCNKLHDSSSVPESAHSTRQSVPKSLVFSGCHISQLDKENVGLGSKTLAILKSEPHQTVESEGEKTPVESEGEKTPAPGNENYHLDASTPKAKKPHLHSVNSAHAHNSNGVADKTDKGVGCRNLASSDKSNGSTSVDEALADFFNSPETSAKQRRNAPGKTKKRFTANTAEKTFSKLESAVEINVSTDFRENPILVKRMSDNKNCGSKYMYAGTSDECGQDGTGAVTELSHHSFGEARTEVAAGSEGDPTSLETDLKYLVEDANSSKVQDRKSDRPCVKQPETGSSLAVTVNLTNQASSDVISTPPSILRSSEKRRQIPSSQKRVRFAEDFIGKASTSQPESKDKEKKRLASCKVNKNKEPQGSEKSSSLREKDDRNNNSEVTDLSPTEKQPLTSDSSLTSAATLPCVDQTPDHSCTAKLQTAQVYAAESKLSEAAVPSKKEETKSATAELSLAPSAETNCEGLSREEFSKNQMQLNNMPEHQQLPETLNLGRNSIAEVSVQCVPHDFDRSIRPQETSKVDASAKPESTETAMNAEKNTGLSGNKAKDVASVQSVAQPKLRLGQKKMRCFLYPSSSQIMETCPRNVFHFESSDVTAKPCPETVSAPGRIPATPNDRHQPGSMTSFVEHHVLEETACENFTTLPSPSLLDITSGPSTTERFESGLDNALDCQELVETDCVKKQKENRTLPFSTVDDEEMEMLEDPGWSEVDDYAIEGLDAEDPSIIREQKPSGNGSRQNPDCGACQGFSDAEVDSSLLCKKKKSSCNDEPGKRSTDLLMLPGIPSTSKTRLASDQKEVSSIIADSSGTVSSSQEAFSSTASVPHSLPSACQQTAAGFLKRLTTPTDPLNLHVPRVSVTAKQEVRDLQTDTDTVTENPQADLQKELRDELLYDVDFSQELLSQSKSNAESGLRSGNDDGPELNEKMCIESNLESETVTDIAKVTDCQTVPVGNQQTKPSPETAKLGDKIRELSSDLSFMMSDNCIGFKSAAGKSIKLTQKALVSAKSLFLESDATLPEVDCIEGTIQQSVLSNSHNNDASILPRASLLLDKGLKSTLIRSERNAFISAPCGADDAEKCTVVSSVCGFKTASGKDFALSSKHQKKAEEMWKAVEKELENNGCIPCDRDCEIPQSRTHKEAVIGETPLSRSHADSKESSGFSAAVHADTNSGLDFSDPGLQVLGDKIGFKTAGGKAMKLSSAAHQRAVELWKCVEKEVNPSVDSLHGSYPAASGTEESGFLPMPKPPDNRDAESMEKTGTKCGKSVNTLNLKSPLPARNVPQGFRPFKPPKVVKKVSEEEKYTPKLIEQPKPDQKNIILNHFSKVKLPETRGISKRKHSDDFSDDDEQAWDLDHMEEFINSENSVTSKESRSEPTTSSTERKTIALNSVNKETFSADKVTAKTEAQDVEKGEDQTQDQHFVESKNQKVNDGGLSVQKTNPLIDVQCKVDTDIEGSNFVDEEMSDAVLTDLTHDMYELTQAEPVVQQCEQFLSEQNKKRASFQSLRRIDEQFLKQYTEAKLGLPSQDSHKSLSVVNISFESLRCDEDISYEEKDSIHNHADLNISADSKEERQQDEEQDSQKKFLNRKMDFDSSMQDQTANSTFVGENVCNESVVESEHLVFDSSYAEKDTLDISCLETELDTTYVEISGGVVWGESKESDTKSRSSVDVNVTSLDFDREEKSVEASLIEATQDIKNEEGMLAEDTFDASCFEADSRHTDIKLVKKKALPDDLNDKATLASVKRPRVGELVTDARDMKERHKTASVSLDKVLDDALVDDLPAEEEKSPVDSLANLSWTDITSTLNPSQWEKDGKTSEADHVTQQVNEIDDGENCQEHFDADGKVVVPLPFSSGSGSVRNTDAAERSNMKAAIESKMDGVSAKCDVVETKCSSGTAFEKEDSSLRNQLCIHSEGFQITSGLSQFFFTQINQDTNLEELNNADDSCFVDADSRTANTAPSHYQNSSSKHKGTDCVSPLSNNVYENKIIGNRTGASPTNTKKILASVNSPASSGTCLGFHTAGRKQLQASKMSLEKIQALFKDDFEDLASDVSNHYRDGEHCGAAEPLKLPLTQMKTGSETCTASGQDTKGGGNLISKSFQTPSYLPVRKAVSGVTAKDGSAAGCSGFQTASGKTVTVSDTSAEKATLLFDGEVQNLTEAQKSVTGSVDAASESSSESKMAEYASGKFEVEADRSVRLERNVVDTHYGPLPTSRSNPGFQTASGASVTVDEKSLSHARNLLWSDQNHFNVTENKTDEASAPDEPALPGFQTARGASVSVSKKALTHARSLFSGEDVEKEQSVQAMDQEQTVPGCAGFQTAAGEKVTVSAKSLTHAKTVFSECSQKQSFNSENKNTSGGVSSETLLAVGDIGFHTAGGGKVSVSTKSLQHAREVLDSTENKSCDKSNSLTLSRNRPSDTSPHVQKFEGFQTAAGRSVTVSEKALESARKTLESVDTLDSDRLPESLTCKTSGVRVPAPAVVGFQTAGGRSVNVSEKALQHVHEMLRADEEFTAARDLTAPTSEPKSSFGFQTAGGANVSVSHKSLQHAQDLFKDGTEEQHLGSFLNQGMQSDSQVLATSAEDLRDVHQASHNLSVYSGKAVFCVPSPKKLRNLTESTTTEWVQQFPSKSRDDLNCQGNRNSPIKRQERKSKESLQPIVSDDSGLAEEDGEQTEASCDNSRKDAVVQKRTAVKRTALYASSEAFLHDRSAKRFKLQPATANEQRIQDVPHPHLQSRTALLTCTVKSSSSGKSMATFQPPYKKAKFTPPTGKKPGEGSCKESSRKPGFRPPILPSFACSPGKDGDLRSAVQEQSSKKARSSSRDTIMDSPGAVISQHLSEVNQEPVKNVSVAQKTCPQNKPSSADETPEAQSETDQSAVSNTSQSEQISSNSNQSVPAISSSFNVEEARMRQEKMIRQKKRQTIRPVRGRWLSQKLSQQQRSFEDLHQVTRWRCQKELLHLGVSRAVCSVSSRNAEDFRFYLPSFYPGWAAGVLIGDGALLLPDKQGYAGKEEFYSAFLTIDGVDPALVTEAWLNNHYRWIVWKLAAYEVALPDSFASRALTPDFVMFQLKYRYDREVDGCQRSAVKRIVERDDTPSKRLVICVSDIKSAENSEVGMLEVTDGWYCLPCKPDAALQHLVDSKKLVVGQKLITTGAELAGSHQSCSPLEICAGLHLKLHDNSTRPAPGAAKLGYQRCPTPLCVPLSSLHPLGGLVGCVDVVVVRKYPLMFMEKRSGGGCVFRTIEMEEKARQKHEDKRQGVMEKLCSQLQAQMEKEEDSRKKGCGRQSLKRQEVQALSTGAEISDALDAATHPEELQDMLSGSQIEQLLECRHRQQEERRQQLNEQLQQALQQSASQELYSRENIVTDRAVENTNILLVMEELDVPPSMEELSKAIDRLASGKAPGSDGIPAEVIKAGKESALLDHLHELLLQCWEEGTVPQDMCDANIGQRTVVPLQKLRIAGCCRRDIDSKTGLMLTVWRPGGDWESVQEGKRYRMYSLTASPARCRTSGQQVEVTAGRQTRFQAAKIEENLLDLIYEPREVYGVTDLQRKTPPYNEFDFVGMIVCVRTALRGSDAVYAVDNRGNLLLIWFWGGLEAFSLQDVLTEGTAFSACNLRLKSSGKDWVECCAGLETSHFSTTGKTAAQRQRLQCFKQKDWTTQLLEMGKQKLAVARPGSKSSVAPVTEELEDLPPSFLDKLLAPLTQEASSEKQNKDSMDVSTTAHSSSVSVCSTSDTSVCPNASTMSTQSLSPQTQEAKRKRMAQREKLARLQSYGRAPCLSPFPCIMSPAAGKAFKPPTPHRK